MIDKVAAATKPTILLSHAIVIMETNKANLHENLPIVVDMLFTKICAQRKEKPAMLAE